MDEASRIPAVVEALAGALGLRVEEGDREVVGTSVRRGIERASGWAPPPETPPDYVAPSWGREDG